MNLTRRTFLGTTGTSVAFGLAGCSGGSGDGGGTDIPETTTIAMVDTQFDPRNTHVDTGATVTWENEDDTAHTVTSASDNWSKDAEVAGGEQTTHTFEQAEVYEVYCTFHGSTDLSGMSMKIGVGDATIEDPLGDGDSDDGGGVY